MAEFLKLMENWDGYVPVRAVRLGEAAQARFLDLISNADRMPTHRHDYLLREAVTTSDFPALFGLTLEQQVLAKYRAVVGDWRQWTKIKTVPNFNRYPRHKIYGNDNYLPQVSEKGEYLVRPSGTAPYYVQVFKHGAQFDISWESTINDILGAFEDIPERFATAAIRTLARDATALYASAAGPNVRLFGAPIADVDGQAVINLGILPLTITNIEDTLSLMAQQPDPNGEPISVRGIHLVVPPALEFRARSILTSALKQWTDVIFAAAQPMPTTNILPQLGLQLHVDPYLPVVDRSGNANRTWYLFADPSQGEAVEMDFLRGHEEPEICMKASDKVTVGGTSLSPFSGDFASDNVFYRVRIVHGGTQLDPRFAYAQVGAVEEQN